MVEKIEYLSPSEILEKYPVEEKFGWTERDIRIFFTKRLLQGRYHALRKVLIREDSLIRLIHFTNDQIESQRVNMA
ncbi:MAG: hypothetical protein ACXVPU_04685 [Bacteroidia bacterium]